MADDIVAYINGLAVSPASRHTRLFQPGGTVLESDGELAIRLFGQDRWPLDLTPDQLLAMELRDLPIALPLLEWSMENSEQDWMPDRPLPETLLAAGSGALRSALDEYYERRSMPTLMAALDRFDELTRGEEDSDRVCAGAVAFHTRADDCFDARRWMASLAAQHLLREGTEDVPLRILDLWWDVGEAAVSQSFDRVRDPPARQAAYESSAKWLYLAWLHDPLRADDNPLYFPEQLRHAGFRRHVAFSMLYSMVLDPEGWDGARPYIFHLQTFHRVPEHWAYDVGLWGYEVLESYLDAGIRPVGAGLVRALNTLEIADRLIAGPVQTNLTQEQRDTLTAAVARLRARLEG